MFEFIFGVIVGGLVVYYFRAAVERAILAVVNFFKDKTGPSA